MFELRPSHLTRPERGCRACPSLLLRSDIPRWLSDALCQLVFGGAVSGRALFTNDDRSFIYAQRPVLLSGIGDFVRWADLKDRCVFLRLPPIPPTRCRGEDEFWKAFQADRPGILGAVLDAMVGGLANCRRSISRNCRAWPITPSGVKRSAEDWDGSPGRSKPTGDSH